MWFGVVLFLHVHSVGPKLVKDHMLRCSLPEAVEQHTCVTEEEAVNKTRQRKQGGKCSRESRGFEELMRKSSLVLCRSTPLVCCWLSFVCLLFGLWCNRSTEKGSSTDRLKGGMSPPTIAESDSPLSINWFSFVLVYQDKDSNAILWPSRAVTVDGPSYGM